MSEGSCGQGERGDLNLLAGAGGSSKQGGAGLGKTGLLGGQVVSPVKVTGIAVWVGGSVVGFKFTFSVLEDFEVSTRGILWRRRSIDRTSVAHHWRIVCCSACHPFRVRAPTPESTEVGPGSGVVVGRDSRQGSQEATGLFGGFEMCVRCGAREERTSFRSGASGCKGRPRPGKPVC